MTTKAKPYEYQSEVPPEAKWFAGLSILGFIGALYSLSYFQNYGGKGAFLGFFLGIFIGAYCVSQALMLYMSSSEGKLDIAKEVVGELSLRGDEKVLDLGCGSGLFLILLAKHLHEHKVVGIDDWSKEPGAQKVVKFNAQRAGVLDRIELVTADARELPFGEASFDHIISNRMLHNLSTAKERLKVLEEISRVLRPTGMAVILDYWFIEDYKKFFESRGWEVELSRADRRVYPAIRILKAKKPFHATTVAPARGGVFRRVRNPYANR